MVAFWLAAGLSVSPRDLAGRERGESPPGLRPGGTQIIILGAESVRPKTQIRVTIGSWNHDELPRRQAWHVERSVFDNAIAASTERYERFIRRVVENGMEEFFARPTEKTSFLVERKRRIADVAIIVFWSDGAYATSCAKDEWQDYRPQATPWNSPRMAAEWQRTESLAGY